MCLKGYFAKGESIFLSVSENFRFCSFIIRLKSFCVTFFFLDVKVPAIFSPVSLDLWLHTTAPFCDRNTNFIACVPKKPSYKPIYPILYLVYRNWNAGYFSSSTSTKLGVCMFKISPTTQKLQLKLGFSYCCMLQ